MLNQYPCLLNLVNIKDEANSASILISISETDISIIKLPTPFNFMRSVEKSSKVVIPRNLKGSGAKFMATNVSLAGKISIYYTANLKLLDGSEGLNIV